jgi:hypothetical protein
VSDLFVHIRSAGRQYARAEASVPIWPEAVTEDQMYACFPVSLRSTDRWN